MQSIGRTQSFYSSSRRPNDAQSLVCGIPRRRSRRALHPLQANDSTSGYLPGMSLSDLTSSVVRDGSLSPQHSNGSFDPLDDEPHHHDVAPHRHDVTPRSHDVTPRSQFSANDDSIMALLQNQQTILQQVLQGQVNLENQQSQLQKRLNEVEKWRTESQTPVSSSSPDSSSGKRKRVVTRELTVSLLCIFKWR